MDTQGDRRPYAVRAEFRTTSSFLVAYSIHLARGGLFLDADVDLPSGTPLTVDLAIPSIGTVSVNGVIAWRRGGEPGEAVADPTGAGPGIGIELEDVAAQLGGIIDRLVAGFHGVQILVLSGDRQDRTSLARSIKSIISTAEVMQVADSNVALTLMSGEIDLAVVDVDFDVEGGLNALRAAKIQDPPVPTIALTMNSKLHEHARAAGADGIATNPPPFGELQVLMVRALSKPTAVRFTV